MTKKEFDVAVASAKAGMESLEEFVKDVFTDTEHTILYYSDANIDMTMALNYAKVAYNGFGYACSLERVFDYLAHWYSAEYDKLCVLVDFLYNYLSTIAEGGTTND